MTNCTICLEQIDKNFLRLSCNHLFHKVCIDRWIETCNYKFKCPICRKKYILLQNDYIEISSLSDLYIFAVIYLVFFIIVLRNILN